MKNNIFSFYVGGVTIGSNCSITKDVNLGSEPYLISMGDNVRLTKGCALITHDGGLYVPRNMGLIDKRADKIKRIKIGNNVNFGNYVIVLPGVTIGDNVIIGAGALVTKDVPDNCVVAGVPAKYIESIEDYVKKNENSVIMTHGLTHDEKRKLLMRHKELVK